MEWLRRYVQFKWDNHLSRKRGLLPRQERDAITYMLTAGKYPTYDDYERDYERELSKTEQIARDAGIDTTEDEWWNK